MPKSMNDFFENLDWSGGKPRVPRSGPGSTMSATQKLRDALPGVFEAYNVKTFLDAPCGDWHWMQTVDLSGIEYLGFDVSHSVVAENKQYEAENIKFDTMDITVDPLPAADIMLCRDCLFHLKFEYRWMFFANFLKADIPHLMTTSHFVSENSDMRRNGKFKRFNMREAPFFFPEPLEMILETADELPQDLTEWHTSRHRYVGIWSREQVAAVVAEHMPS